MAKDLTLLETLCIEYHYMTEHYDRSLPHSISPRTGDSIIYPEYRSLSNAYAHRIHKRIKELSHGYSGVEIRYMMNYIASYPYEELQRRYQLLNGYYLVEQKEGEPEWRRKIGTGLSGEQTVKRM